MRAKIKPKEKKRASNFRAKTIPLIATVFAIVVGLAIIGNITGLFSLQESEHKEFPTYKFKDVSVCTENEKPVVYMFSTSWCPHCEWLKEPFDSTVKEYIEKGKIVAYHWQLDTYDNTLTEKFEGKIPQAHIDLFKQYSPQGSVPTIVVGCKYYRIGTGYEITDEKEKEVTELTEVIEEILVNN